MHRSIGTFLWLFALAMRLTAQTPTPASPPKPPGLVWDALEKEASPKSADGDVLFTFAVTNRAPNRITIQSVDTSCGCTVAEIPSEPWPLDPGQGGLLKVEFDARDKYGDLTKTIYVQSTAGEQTLTIKIHLPEAPPNAEKSNPDRITNLMQASRNRQSVFQGKCATCHVTPASGEMGQELYTTACGICHDAVHRASMVPNLKTLTHGTPASHWENWTRNGKPMSLMPAFEQKQGGPLTEAQIQSLVVYLSKSKEFPSNTVKTTKPAAKP